MTRRVYGRKEYAQPLIEIGIVDDTSTFAAAKDDDWVELIAFPDDAIHWIVRDGKDVDDG